MRKCTPNTVKKIRQTKWRNIPLSQHHDSEAEQYKVNGAVNTYQQPICLRTLRVIIAVKTSGSTYLKA